MIGACGLALLPQGQEFEQGVPGDFWARARGVVRGSIGSRDGNAKPEGIPIGHHDVTRALEGMADRQDLEASAVQGMSGVGHLDDFGIELRWVLEGGIMLLGRSMLWTTVTCMRSSAGGYVTASCCD